jgi:multicomponent Na+:H+ antiporter subunit B
LKYFFLLLTFLTGALLIYGALDMPDFGDPNSPPNAHLSPRFIEKALEETEVPNMVTAVLADYRGFDTLGETTVVFAAAVSVLLILRKPRCEEEEQEETKEAPKEETNQEEDES